MSSTRKKEQSKEHRESKSLQQKEETPLNDRLTYLENAIQKLQYQQEQLAPLLDLTNNVPALIKVESTSKMIAQKYRDIEECIQLYGEQIQELRKQANGLSNKVKGNLQEESAKREKEGKALINHIIDVQNSVKQLDLENQMEIKNLQVSSKEETIQVVENFDSKIITVKNQYSQQIQEVIKNQDEKLKLTQKNILQQTENFEKFKVQSSQQLVQINSNITPNVTGHITVANEGLLQFQEELLKQLEELIENTVNQEKNQIIKKQKAFHLKFSQEMLSLRGDIEKIRDVFEEKFKGELLESVLTQPPDKKLSGLNQEVRKKLDNLRNSSGKAYEGIQDIIQQVQESLLELAQLENYNFETAQENIQQIKTQIQQIMQEIESLSIKNQSDLYKLQEQQKLVEELRGQLVRMQANEPFEKRNLIQKETELSTAQGNELANFKKEIGTKSEETQKEVQKLNKDFSDIMMRAEKQFGVKFADTKQQKQMFKMAHTYGAKDNKQPIDYNEAVIDLKNK